jgi:hypothetical protein
MNTLPTPRLLFLLAVVAPVILALQPASVDAQTKRARPPQGVAAETAEKDKMNAWTVGLAGGLLEGADRGAGAEHAGDLFQSLRQHPAKYAESREQEHFHYPAGASRALRCGACHGVAGERLDLRKAVTQSTHCGFVPRDGAS